MNEFPNPFSLVCLANSSILIPNMKKTTIELMHMKIVILFLIPDFYNFNSRNLTFPIATRNNAHAYSVAYQNFHPNPLFYPQELPPYEKSIELRKDPKLAEICYYRPNVLMTLLDN